MKTDKVSVLMTVYNTAKYLDRSINSIIKQTYKNFELIIVDDGSEDNSKKIISSYKNKKIKKFFLKKNVGRINALKYAIKKSSGKYIAILDSDDVSNTNRLNTQVKFFKSKKEIMLIASKVTFIDDKNNKLFSYPKKFDAINYNEVVHFRNIFPFSTVMFRREVLKNVPLFSRKIKYAFDYDFVLRVKKKYKIFLIPKILGQFTRRENSLTTNENLSFQRISDLINILNYSKNNFNLTLKIKILVNTKIFLENIFLLICRFKNFIK
tara:strand:+ start:16664 stop:17461 length:798 start_codon:yes stop_codon:yes gene_type:complete